MAINPEAFYKKVGNNITRLRKAKGFSTIDLGHESGIDKSTIVNIEGGRNITLATILKIAEGLGVEPYKLLE